MNPDSGLLEDNGVGVQPTLNTTPAIESATASGDDKTSAKPAEGDTGHQGEEEKAPTPQEEREPQGDDAPAAEGE